jgi:hypothetical protein
VGRALDAFAPVWDALPGRAPRPAFADVRAAIDVFGRRHRGEVTGEGG